MASIFDCKKNEIIKLISEGYSNREIFDKLFDENMYSFEGMRSYINQRGYRKNMHILDCVPKCKECKECVKIEPWTKINGTLMYCKKKKKQVRPDLQHCPKWCHKRKEVMKSFMEDVEKMMD